MRRATNGVGEGCFWCILLFLAPGDFIDCHVDEIRVLGKKFELTFFCNFIYIY